MVGICAVDEDDGVGLGCFPALPSETGREGAGRSPVSGGFARDGASGSDVRFDGDAKGAAGQALGRSRGGFGTKIHLKTDFDGLPIAFDLTGGHAADSPQFKTLRDLGPASSLRTRPVTALETAASPGKTSSPAGRTSKTDRRGSQGRSIGAAPASNRPSESSGASNPSHCAARKPKPTSNPSSRSPTPSS